MPGLEASCDPLHVYPFAHWLVIGHGVGDGAARWHFIHRSSHRLCAALDWPLHHAQLRLVGDECVLFDHQGRLWHIDLARSVTAALSMQ
ncbi:hypothetical protein [Pseudomonas sp. St316]|uniref:hypothetical protein n=1 Tax=Pseudomonas sp. St316 TaxID=2678257 RepID=UPI001BB3FC47|nr:hypothetical protein [Pseudomonas sp. St316]